MLPCYSFYFSVLEYFLSLQIVQLANKTKVAAYMCVAHQCALSVTGRTQGESVARRGWRQNHHSCSEE